MVDQDISLKIPSVFEILLVDTITVDLLGHPVTLPPLVLQPIVIMVLVLLLASAQVDLAIHAYTTLTASGTSTASTPTDSQLELDFVGSPMPLMALELFAM